MGDMWDSRLGKILVIIYTLFTITIYFASFACGTAACSLYIVLPIMPWAFILTQDLGVGFPWALYPIFILLNASVLYVVGVALEWLYDRFIDNRPFPWKGAR